MNRSKKQESSLISDDQLINDFQKGKMKAFDQLVLKYQNKIFNLCYRFLGNYDDADDCAQDTFVKAYKNLEKFKCQSSFSTWLYRIAINTCKNKLSSLEYRFKTKMVWLDKPKQINNAHFHRELKDEAYSPSVLYEQKEKQALIHKAIESLPKKQKTVVLLRDIENLAYEEIVQITGLKLGTVKSKLARAREHLRIKLKGVI